MRWLMEDLRSASDFRLQLIVTGSHLSEAHGLTYREIEMDGFDIDATVPIPLDGSDFLSLSKAVGHLTGDLAYAFSTLRPDLVMVMGDRYELLAVLSACILGTIPIAHISGGEITEGAIDDQIRHAMTKAAHLHFVANEVYAARVRQMGEEDWRVCVSGEPGLDNLHRQPIMTSDELSADLGLDLSLPTALVTYHPVTLEIERLDEQMAELLAALENASVQFGLQYVITYPNADLGSDRIVTAWHRFAKARSGRVLVKSMGQRRYLSALRTMSMMIGNSSSGLVEAPSFRMPVVNVGNRQGGRLRGTNVIDTDCNRASVLRAIDHALNWDRSAPCANPYGDGRSSEKVLAHLRQVFSRYDRNRILGKKFHDLEDVSQAQLLGYASADA
jgi:GDP/UDP-N,N'-diacetylbacillosamine 2-epimerase (hydrolysing)